MALVTRLSRLFQADFHAVLDRIEEPDLQLRQAVREMQFALEQDQQRLKLLQHEATQLGKATTDAEANLKGFDEELDICLAAKKDDLARDLIRRKLTGEKQLQLSLGRFGAVAAVDQVEAVGDPEIAPDGPGICLGAEGGAHHLAAHLDHAHAADCQHEHG